MNALRSVRSWFRGHSRIASVALLGVVAAAALAVLLTRPDPAAEPVAASEDVGCSSTTFTSQGSSHQPQPGFAYNSFPPTSGPAWLDSLPFEVYRTPVDQIRLLHNLAHGGVAVQYGSAVPGPVVAEIERWYLAEPRGLLVAPLPELDKRVALTAWTQLVLCPEFEESAFSAFRDAYLFHGPERLSPAALDPPGTEPRILLGEIRVEPGAEEGVRIVLEAREPLVIHAAAILDEEGHAIRRLVVPAGTQQGDLELAWDGVTEQGGAAQSGTYTVQVDAVSLARNLTQSASASFVLP